jgi:hypothetical protein
LKALEKGAYRYHSPEVIWPGGAIENPDGGEIEGPLIIGAALLHTPHLGEAAALYSVEPFTQEVNMSEEMTIPVSLWEKLTSQFQREPEPEPEIEPVIETDEFKAVVKERDDYKSEIEAMEAEREGVELLAVVSGEFAEHEALKEDEKLFELLAKIKDEELRDDLISRFKALGEQADSGLEDEIGTDEEGETETDPAKVLDKAVHAKMAEEESMDYASAMAAVATDNPELLSAYDPSADRIREKGV